MPRTAKREDQNESCKVGLMWLSRMACRETDLRSGALNAHVRACRACGMAAISGTQLQLALAMLAAPSVPDALTASLLALPSGLVEVPGTVTEQPLAAITPVVAGVGHAHLAPPPSNGPA